MYRKELKACEERMATRPARESEDTCGEHHDGWTCTCAREHAGDHVAHKVTRPVYATWDDDRTTDTEED